MDKEINIDIGGQKYTFTKKSKDNLISKSPHSRYRPKSIFDYKYQAYCMTIDEADKDNQAIEKRPIFDDDDSWSSIHHSHSSLITILELKDSNALLYSDEYAFIGFKQIGQEDIEEWFKSQSELLSVDQQIFDNGKYQTFRIKLNVNKSAIDFIKENPNFENDALEYFEPEIKEHLDSFSNKFFIGINDEEQQEKLEDIFKSKGISFEKNEYSENIFELDYDKIEIDPNELFELIPKGDGTFNDLSYSRIRGLVNMPKEEYWSLSTLRVKKIWKKLEQIGCAFNTIKVGVIDLGFESSENINYSNHSIIFNGLKDESYNVNEDFNKYNQLSHGRICSELIGGIDKPKGVCKSAEIIAVALNSSSNSVQSLQGQFTHAIRHLLNQNVDVISISLNRPSLPYVTQHPLIQIIENTQDFTKGAEIPIFWAIDSDERVIINDDTILKISNVFPIGAYKKDGDIIYDQGIGDKIDLYFPADSSSYATACAAASAAILMQFDNVDTVKDLRNCLYHQQDEKVKFKFTDDLIETLKHKNIMGTEKIPVLNHTHPLDPFIIRYEEHEIEKGPSALGNSFSSWTYNGINYYYITNSIVEKAKTFTELLVFPGFKLDIEFEAENSKDIIWFCIQKPLTVMVNIPTIGSLEHILILQTKALPIHPLTGGCYPNIYMGLSTEDTIKAKTIGPKAKGISPKSEAYQMMTYKEEDDKVFTIVPVIFEQNQFGPIPHKDSKGNNAVHIVAKIKSFSKTYLNELNIEFGKYVKSQDDIMNVQGADPSLFQESEGKSWQSVISVHGKMIIPPDMRDIEEG